MVEINIEVLRSVRSMKEDKAQQIIDQTTKAILNWKTLIDVKRVNEKSIIVEVPTNLDEDLLIIVLMNKEVKTVAALGYDQKEKKFLQQEEDED